MSRPYIVRYTPDTNEQTRTKAMRHIQLIRKAEGFIIAGTEAWAQASTPRMVLHDVFHHASEDDGSMACEIMSYGTQAWIEHHTDELHLGVSYDELSAVIESTAESRAAAEAIAIFKLAPPPIHPSIEERFLSRFKEIVTQAFQESALTESLAKIPDIEMSSICDEPNLDRCAAWMSFGFTRAQERFPDPEATRELFNRLHTAMKKWSKLDKTDLLIILDERRSTVTSPDIDFVDILLGCCPDENLSHEAQEQPFSPSA